MVVQSGQDALGAVFRVQRSRERARPRRAPVLGFAAGALGTTTAIPSGSNDFAGAILRLPEVGLVDLEQAHYALVLVRNDPSKKRVAPPKRLIHSHDDPVCGDPDLSVQGAAYAQNATPSHTRSCHR